MNQGSYLLTAGTAQTHAPRFVAVGDKEGGLSMALVDQHVRTLNGMQFDVDLVEMRWRAHREGLDGVTMKTTEVQMVLYTPADDTGRAWVTGRRNHELLFHFLGVKTRVKTHEAVEELTIE
jgi:hypothetical protein